MTPRRRKSAPEPTLAPPVPSESPNPTNASPLAAAPSRELIDFRPALTTHLTKRLLAFCDGFRHNLAVLGPSGSGKSMLLRRVAQAADARLLVIDCPLEPGSVRTFARRFTAALLRAGAEAAGEDRPEALLEMCRQTLPRTAAAAEGLLSAAGAQADLLTRTLDLVPLAYQDTGRPCVVLLDEFLHLGRLGMSQAFHELGKRVVTWPFGMFVVTSSALEEAKQILRERLQMLFGHFETVSLGPVEPSAAIAAIHPRGEGADEASLGMLRDLIAWTGESAWALQALGRRLRERQLLTGADRWDRELLADALWDTLGDADGVLGRWYANAVERVRACHHGPLACEALLSLARGARTASQITHDCGCSRYVPQALELLQEQGVVERLGTCWRLPDAVFEFWLTASCEPRADGVSSLALERFRQAVDALWSRWQSEAARPLAARAQELLAQFGNETVVLEQKTGRLPAFHQIHLAEALDTRQVYVVADGQGQRWCALVHEGAIDEADVAAFERFCRAQLPRPSRKVVMPRRGLDLNARLIAKDANMWVWEPVTLNVLLRLFGHPPLRAA